DRVRARPRARRREGERQRRRDRPRPPDRIERRAHIDDARPRDEGEEQKEGHGRALHRGGPGDRDARRAVSQTAVATALVLLSALLHAAWNAVLKREEDPAAGAATILAISVACATAWALLWPGVAFPNCAAIAWTVAAGACEAAYFVALARSLA